MTEHHLGHVDVGDDAVSQGPNGRDPFGRAANHPLGLEPDTHDPPRSPVYCYNRGLVKDDSLASDVDERISRPEIDSDVVGADQSASSEPPLRRPDDLGISPV